MNNKELRNKIKEFYDYSKIHGIEQDYLLALNILEYMDAQCKRDAYFKRKIKQLETKLNE